MMKFYHVCRKFDKIRKLEEIFESLLIPYEFLAPHFHVKNIIHNLNVKFYVELKKILGLKFYQKPLELKNGIC
jgi:hypothetical protein